MPEAGSGIRDRPAQARDPREQARLVAGRVGEGRAREGRRGRRARDHQDARRRGGRSPAARARGEGLLYQRDRGGAARRSHRRGGALAQRSADHAAGRPDAGGSAGAGPPRRARGRMSGAGGRVGRDAGCPKGLPDGRGRRDAPVWARDGAGWLGSAHGIRRHRREQSGGGGRRRGGLAPGPGCIEIARPMSQFPIRRLRRLRRTAALRRLVQETHLVPSQLVWPLFACHGEGVRREVAALPGVFQTSVDELVRDAERARRLGLGGIILFGLPAAKDATGSEAYDEQGIVQQAARAVKRATPDLLVIGDACLCEYTDHGHCGVVQDGDVDNDASVYLLGKVAVTQARAGIDIVAPSDMMDGRVAGIRKALDAAGFSRLPIMSYAAKMASAFYGPFREAAGSTPQFGDRQSYQMQGTNADEAMREIRLDVEEGADIVLVKPALPCLDLIRRAKQEFGSPLAAYQVSGEYAMIKAAAARGMLDEARAMWETLYAIRRAGADIILSYFAPTVAESL